MKKNLKRTVLILCCFCIAFSCTYIVNANSVSALLHSDENYVITSDLPVLVNPVNYYFTTGVTCEYDVTFQIRQRADMGGAAKNIYITKLSKDSTETGTLNVYSNYALAAIYGNTQANPKKNCVAGALLYDSSDSSMPIEIERINAEVE